MKSFGLLILVALTPAPAAFAVAAAKPASLDVVRAIGQLSGGEKEAEVAATQLRAEPRAKVLSVLREELAATPEPSPLILRALVVLEARELVPALQPALKTSEQWQVFTTVNQLTETTGASESTKEIYLKRLQDWGRPAAKLAQLEGLAQWRAKISDDLFADLLQDSSLRVREAAWQLFLQTQTIYSASVQQARYVQAFSAQPFEVRRSAYDAYSRMPAAVKKTWQVKLPDCAKETHPRAKVACESMKGASR